MLYFRCVGSLFPTKVPEIILQIALVDYFMSFAGNVWENFLQKFQVSLGSTNLTTVLALPQTFVGRFPAHWTGRNMLHLAFCFNFLFMDVPYSDVLSTSMVML